MVSGDCSFAPQLGSRLSYVCPPQPYCSSGQPCTAPCHLPFAERHLDRVSARWGHNRACSLAAAFLPGQELPDWRKLSTSEPVAPKQAQDTGSRLPREISDWPFLDPPLPTH